MYAFVIISRTIILGMKMRRTKVVEKIGTHILCSIFSPRKLCHLWGNVEKCCGAREATYDNVLQCRKDAVFMLDNQDKSTDTVSTPHLGHKNCSVFVL